MTGINATCQLYFQVNWVKPFIVVLIITEHNRGQQVYSSLIIINIAVSVSCTHLNGTMGRWDAGRKKVFK